VLCRYITVAASVVPKTTPTAKQFTILLFLKKNWEFVLRKI